MTDLSRSGQREGTLRSARVTGRGLARPVLVAALLAAGAAVFAYASAPSAAAEEPFRGDVDIQLGASFRASFPDPPPGPHRYSFFAPAGTTVSASVRARDGVSLVPSLHLTHPGGDRVRLGRSIRAARRGPRIDRFRVPYAGFYVLEVVATRGAGGYTLETGGRVGRRMLGLFPAAPSGEEGFAFDAAQSARVSVRISPRRRGPRLEITGISGPAGDTIPVLSLQDGPAAEIRDVVLPEGGRFRVTWTNRGTPGDLRLSFRFRPPAGAPALADLGVSDGLAVSVIEHGDPVLRPRAGYIGSAACGRCHDELVRSWSDTAHNSAVRAWNRAGLSGLTMANDADGNGVDDFRDGLDLATTPAFAAYGVNAPKLLYVAGNSVPYQVRIGATTYLVDRTMGGNGLWLQRYLALTGVTFAPVGRNRNPLPFEFDEKSRTYAAYRPQDWYDAARNPLPVPPPERTFEAQCSGCHNTGEQLVRDFETDQFLTSYVELNIGCEQCHGPGAGHASNGDVRRISNPRRLLDDTSAGVAAANDVCARCHTKGESVGTLPGSTARTEFGLAGGNVAQAGDRLTDFLSPTRNAADFWGRKVDPLPTVPGDTSVAARSDRPHGQDIAVGAHGAPSANSGACFDCHDPHRRSGSHQIAASVTRDDRGVRVATRMEDNSLCLSCHAQLAGDVFEALPRTSAAGIRGNAAPAAVARAVIDHMKDSGMPVREGLYDPVGTGVGRCTTCHMPKTPTVGAPGRDEGGFAAGDLHSHRFEIVWPNASVAHGVTNSCNVCHPTGPLDAVGPILTQWATPAPGQTAFHGASPPTSLDGIAFNQRANPSHSGGERRCIACHTSEGFVDLLVHDDAGNMQQDRVDEIAKESIARDRGVTCDACHGRRADGQFHGIDRNPLRMDKAELCAACHNAATVVFQDFRDHGAVVRHPQREMLAGTAGEAPPGAPAAIATTAHSSLPGGCVACHYDADHAVGRHHFRPDVVTCADCHQGLATFDRTARADYDGDGVVRGIQTEVTGLLDRLKTALVADPRVSFAEGRFDFAGATNHALTGATDAQKRAVFNWYSVDDDRSRGVHNAARALQLLQKSYRELTGSDVPGATLR